MRHKGALFLLIGLGALALTLTKQPETVDKIEQQVTTSQIGNKVEQFATDFKMRLSDMLDPDAGQATDTTDLGANSASTVTDSSSSVTSSSQVESGTSSENTPIESIVQDRTLSTSYTYSFAEGTTAAVQHVFLEAIDKYNATGIVKLTAGTLVDDQNHVTFSTYNQTTSNQTGTFELGKGGPQIIEKYSVFESHTTNHATATLNVAYPSAVAESVAIHELGHALGLDHSDDRTSVMYPIDQGLTNLSTADVNGLRAVYQQ
ncbi:M57 family metalloprotease [Lapidilactobacillus mulanensis]|uniref:M57 family metalloprotease n=1 Tax=Lapidilactobacillus mulanensis TaxID=2485999 RepID=A0ABW4DN66_9LACO|nr:M57 family metalloprotease [Lapidilactobacillus mulanensis]